MWPYQFVQLPLANVDAARRCNAVQALDSVAETLYHEGLQAFILVQQFKPVSAARWGHVTATGLPQPPPSAGAQSTLWLNRMQMDELCLPPYDSLQQRTIRCSISCANNTCSAPAPLAVSSRLFA
jgi:hypothetical protein